MTIVSRFTPSAYLLDGGDFTPPSSSRYAPSFNGEDSYIEFSSDTESVTSISFTAKLSSLSGVSAIASHSNTEAIILDPTTNEIRVKRGSWYTILSGHAFDADYHEYIFNADGLSIDGVNVSTTANKPITISRIGNYSITFMNGVIYDFTVNGEVWSLDESFNDYPTITSSLSNTATAYNFTSEDVIELS